MPHPTRNNASRHPLNPSLAHGDKAVNAHHPAVTDTRTFCRTDKADLFSVNAGIPVAQALEQLTHLVACTEHVVLNQVPGNEANDRALLQFLTEMTHALVQACQPHDPELLAQAQRRAKAARQPKARVEVQAA